MKCKFEVVTADSTHKNNQVENVFSKALAGGDELLLIPDMTYPDHPSTGMVADPTVVEWLIRTLIDGSDLTADDMSVLCASSGQINSDTVASLLGYDELTEDIGVDLLYADSDDGLPMDVYEQSTATVLSPRFSSTGTDPLSHASFFDELDGIGDAEYGFSRRLSFSVLDATYLNCGHPYYTNRVFASQRATEIDATISALFGEDSSTSFDDEVLNNISSELNVEKPSTDGIANKIMQFGYQFYTKVSGDVLPPQMEN